MTAFRIPLTAKIENLRETAYQDEKQKAYESLDLRHNATMERDPHQTVCIG